MPEDFDGVRDPFDELESAVKSYGIAAEHLMYVLAKTEDKAISRDVKLALASLTAAIVKEWEG